MDLPKPLQSGYKHEDAEDNAQSLWDDTGYANPDRLIEDNIIDADAPSFSMVLPPPNVTGVLHLGHAFENSLQDIVTRYNRMQGKRTLWVPGTDHAAIATQAKVEKKIYDERGESRYDVGREDFLEEVEEFAQDSHDTIVSQIKALGSSVDWSREAFTLDDQRAEAVRTAFVRLYEKGLIYRGDRVVNWDPKGQTTVSDDEVEHEEVEGKLWTFTYDEDFPIAVSTTRPETKFGDTAIAVHPDDKRYSEYVGQTLKANYLGVELEIQVVADPEIDPEYGTGAVGVTPAHSAVDYEIARRHDLPLKQVINENDELMEVCGEFAGMGTRESREPIIAKLEDAGLLQDTETVTKNVGRAERTGAIIEHLPKLQWFINVNQEFEMDESEVDGIDSGETVTLKKLMRTPVETGQIDIIPERFEKEYFHWIEKLRDWCISRQIWYGHRIPVWYHDDVDVDEPERDDAIIDRSGKQALFVGTEQPTADGWSQDPDTLDTWFSSGLWSFSTLGWPHFAQSATRGKPGPENDLANFHPNSFMNPGYEILFFWVARMILMSTTLVGQVPFKTTYIHGLVRDEDGRKFSKSLGNGVDPVEVVEEYGADALRMALTIGVGPGSDSNFDMDDVAGYRKFANKIWNASKFVLMNVPEDYSHEKPALSDTQETRLEELRDYVADVTKNMENHQYHLAGEKIHNYFWHTFADEVLEENKDAIYGDSETDKFAAIWLLMEMLHTNLRLLHPFMPHVTEVLWTHISPLVNESHPLMVSAWDSQSN